MQVGVPKETKDQEFRVGLSPNSVRGLGDAGHTVFVETGAGLEQVFLTPTMSRQEQKLSLRRLTLGIANSSSR
jgi:alanine dehydrogenase